MAFIPRTSQQGQGIASVPQVNVAVPDVSSYTDAKRAKEELRKKQQENYKKLRGSLQGDMGIANQSYISKKGDKLVDRALAGEIDEDEFTKEESKIKTEAQELQNIHKQYKNLLSNKDEYYHIGEDGSVNAGIQNITDALGSENYYSEDVSLDDVMGSQLSMMSDTVRLIPTETERKALKDEVRREAEEYIKSDTFLKESISGSAGGGVDVFETVSDIAKTDRKKVADTVSSNPNMQEFLIREYEYENRKVANPNSKEFNDWRIDYIEGMFDKPKRKSSLRSIPKNSDKNEFNPSTGKGSTPVFNIAVSEREDEVITDPLEPEKPITVKGGKVMTLNPNPRRASDVKETFTINGDKFKGTPIEITDDGSVRSVKVEYDEYGTINEAILPYEEVKDLLSTRYEITEEYLDNAFKNKNDIGFDWDE